MTAITDITVRELQKNEYETAFSLALKVFMEYEAPEYPQNGVDSFVSSLRDPEYIKMLRIYGAFDGEKLIGIIASRSGGSHVALFFVLGEYHRKGVGKELFSLLKNDCHTNIMTVNSSPYAVEIYKRLGFIPTMAEQMTDGIRYTPMEYTFESFDSAAKSWDNERREKRSKALAELIKPFIAGKIALDFGCGTGLLTFPLAPFAKEICGYDASAGMMEQFVEKIKSTGAPNVAALNKLCGKKFDVIFTSMVLHHIDNIEKQATCFKELLSKSGTLIIIDLDSDDGSFHKDYHDFHGHNGFDRNELCDILKKVGFSGAKAIDAYKGEKEINGESVNYSLFMLTAAI